VIGVVFANGAIPYGKWLNSQCVLISEINPHAVEILRQNHSSEEIWGDIVK
jgi:site-specific DNA-cytosine methylase